MFFYKFSILDFHVKLLGDHLLILQHDSSSLEKFKSGLGECQVISVAEGNHFQFQYSMVQVL